MYDNSQEHRIQLKDQIMSIGTIKSLDKKTTAVEVQRCKIKKGAVEELVKLPAIKQISFSQCGLKVEGLTPLSNANNLASFSFGLNPIQDKETKILCEIIGKLPQLTQLTLFNDDIGDDALRYISALARLTSLNLSFNLITDEGLFHLSKLQKLSSLNLDSNDIGDEGIHRLAQLPKLTNLSIDNNMVTNEGATYLAKIRTMKQLVVFFNPIGNSGVIKLCTINGLNEFYFMNETQVTEWGEQIAKKILSYRKTS